MKKSKPLPINRRSSAVQNPADRVEQLLKEQRLDEVLDLCKKVLAAGERNPAVLHRIGVALIRANSHELAVPAMEQASNLVPGDAKYRNDLGIAQEKAGLLDAAEESYRAALQLMPTLSEAHSNLADLLIKREQPNKGVLHAQHAIEIAPNNPLSWIALGDACELHGKIEDAMTAYEKATQLLPPQAKAFAALARTYLRSGKTDDAITLLRRGLSLCGEDPKLLNDLGMALGSQHKYEESQECFEAAYRALHEPSTLFNILSNLRFMGKLQECMDLTDEVLQHPQPNVSIIPLFGIACGTCRWSLQERILPYVMEWCGMNDGKQGVIAQTMLFMLSIPSVTPRMIRTLSEKHASAVRHGTRHYLEERIAHTNALGKKRKLRVGYMSGDFRLHVVNYFISGILSHYDKNYFEVYCYSTVETKDEDAITEQYRQAVDSFVSVAEMNNEQLVHRIADDGIQLFVDLSGFTAGGRMEIMQRRPAPVQLTYMGFPFTSGMSEIDFAFTDPWITGPDSAESFTEQLLEIAHCASACGELPVRRERREPPFVRNGHITFGSLNNCYKLNAPTVAAWSRILSRLPDARLILNHPGYKTELTRQSILEEFQRNGISEDRVTFIFDAHPKGRHFYWYEDLDIALDNFPQTGATTTVEALWMGVPVVTLVGSVSYQRVSYTTLKNCGVEVDDLIAFNVDDYIEQVVALALNKNRIAELHGLLLDKVPHSEMFDPARHVRHFEDALIEGWNRKVPEHPKFTPETFAYTRLNSPAAPLVATVSAPDDLYCYVVTEQGHWFASEYGAIAELVEHLNGGGVEIGSEPGFFSLELAHTGRQAICLMSSTVGGRLVRAAAERAGIADRVDVRLESPRTNVLDRAELKDVALLRIGVEANDGRGGPVAKNPEFWAGNRPVVLLSIHNGDVRDFSTAERLQALDYRFYRHLPSLGLFVPYRLEDALDPYTLYLLACPPSHEESLVRAGLLVSGDQTVPPAEAALLTQATHDADPWHGIDEWVVRCAAQIRDPHRAPGERWALLQFAVRTQLTVMANSPSTTRRITLARLMADAGQRSDAGFLLDQCMEEMRNGTASISTPFLAPSASWDQTPPDDVFAEWLFASLLETRCRLAAHSTYFLPASGFEPLEMATSLGFSTVFSEGALRADGARQTGR